MGKTQDGEDTRWKTRDERHEMGETRDGEDTRWGRHEMGKTRDGEDTRRGRYETGRHETRKTCDEKDAEEMRDARLGDAGRDARRCEARRMRGEEDAGRGGCGARRMRGEEDTRRGAFEAKIARRGEGCEARKITRRGKLRGEED
jgi:hypothetical protein